WIMAWIDKRWNRNLFQLLTTKSMSTFEELPITRQRGWPMLHQQTFDKLAALKWHGLARALEEQMQQPEVASLSFEERLGMLVDAQWLWRENRALASRLRQAQLKFPALIE